MEGLLAKRCEKRLISDPDSDAEAVMKLLIEVATEASDRVPQDLRSGLPSIIGAMVAYLEGAREAARKRLPEEEVVPCLIFLPVVAYNIGQRLPWKKVYRRALVERDVYWQDYIQDLNDFPEYKAQPMRYRDVRFTFPVLPLGPTLIPKHVRWPTKTAVRLKLKRHGPARKSPDGPCKKPVQKPGITYLAVSRLLAASFTLVFPI